MALIKTLLHYMCLLCVLSLSFLAVVNDATIIIGLLEYPKEVFECDKMIHILFYLVIGNKNSVLILACENI